MVNITPVSKICSVEDCGKPVIAHGICNMHRKRLERHGHLLAGRPKDWGDRENHPLYQTWIWLKRTKGPAVVCDKWNDFWMFVEDVKERPSNSHVLRRKNKELLFSFENYHWVELSRTSGSEDKKQKARIYAKVWRINNKDKAKDKFLQQRYGITLDDYRNLLESQSGVCAICHNPERALNYKTMDVRELAVDHCHKTGEVRGLLCSCCNTGLGSFGDSHAFLQSAINYLTR